MWSWLGAKVTKGKQFIGVSYETIHSQSGMSHRFCVE